MARASNIVIGALNVFFLLVGLSLLAGGVYVHVKDNVATTATTLSLQNSLYLLGAIIFIVSLLGLTGACCKNNCALVIYLILLFFMIIGLLLFTIFAFVVTNERAGQILSNRGFNNYRLGDYSHWLQNHFVNGKNWDVVRDALVNARICKVLASDSNQKGPFNQTFSPVEAGCCQPPAECGFVRQNATTWTGLKSVNNSDCNTWSNEPKELCYNCNSCKAGFLTSVRKEWRILAIFLVCITLFTIIVFSAGCCAKRNNYIHRRRGYGYRGYYYA